MSTFREHCFKEMFALKSPECAWASQGCARAPSESQGQGQEKTKGIGGGLNEKKIKGAQWDFFFLKR